MIDSIFKIGGRNIFFAAVNERLGVHDTWKDFPRWKRIILKWLKIPQYETPRAEIIIICANDFRNDQKETLVRTIDQTVRPAGIPFFYYFFEVGNNPIQYH